MATTKKAGHETLPEAVLAKSGVSFDVGMLARVRFDSGAGQKVSKVLAERLVHLWNGARHLTNEEVARITGVQFAIEAKAPSRAAQGRQHAKELAVKAGVLK
jgi:hypothetical protein